MPTQDRQAASDHTEWTFSTANFTQYYFEFNQVYSLMLLLELLRGPGANLLPPSAENIVNALQLCLDEPIRWPEAVTFEELNLHGPKTIARILMRAAHNTKNEGSK